MSKFDEDGFRRFINDRPEAINYVKAPPPMVEMPPFFVGCTNDSEAIVRLINELRKPYSVQQNGADEMYRRFGLALIFILAKLGDMTP